MKRRRVFYGALLFGAVVLHFAYGQYITHYVLLFLLCLPILSFLISLPAMLSARATLIGSEDVERDRPCRIRLTLENKWLLPTEAILLTMERQNLFTEEHPTLQKLRFFGKRSAEREFIPNTEQLGTVRYRIKKAKACDYLGLITIPIRKSGAVTMTVLPKAEAPSPEPALFRESDQVLKPKPQGFSEEHELRAYRAGDPVNLIHWKLTVKYDEPIVREPQEMLRKNIVLSVDLPATYAQQQSVLEQLRWLSEALMAQKIPYDLYFGNRIVRIRSDGEFDRFIKTVLSEPMRAQPAQPVRSGSDTLVYRILPNEEATV